MPVDTKSSPKTEVSSWKVAEHTSPLNWRVGNDQAEALQSTSSTLSKILISRRQALKELTQLNQLRQTLKNSVLNQVEDSLKTTLAGSQLRELINHRGTQAELNRIINHLTLKPHQDISHLTDAVAKELVAASDHRLQLLVRLASKNTREEFQQQLNKSIDNDPQAKLALKLIESKQVDGVESSQIRESLRLASLTSQSGRPRINGVGESVENELSSAMLTHQSLSEEDVHHLIDDVDARHQLTLSTEEKNQLTDTVIVASATLDQNDNLADLRAQLSADQINADTLSQRLQSSNITSSNLIDESYESDNSTKPAINLDLNSISRISRIVENPELLNDPATYQELLGMPRFSPKELVQQWRTFFKPEFHSTITTGEISSPSFFSEASSTTQSWFKTVGSQAQTGTRGFLDSIRSFFGGAGEGGGASGLGSFLKSGASTVGNGLKSMGSALGQGAKALGKSALTGAKALFGKLAAAIAAAAPEILAAIGITLLVAIVIIGLVVLLQWLTNGAYKKSASSLTPVGGTAIDYSEFPNIVCTDEKTPVAVPRPGNPTAARAWDIVNNLSQGFWCYWNWAKEDYPSLFDEKLFQSNPNPDPAMCETKGCNLFWCTWLVIKAYQETGLAIGGDLLYSPNMQAYFEQTGRFVSAKEATATNISPGSVFFFHVYSGGNRTNHVAIVTSVSQDSIVFVHSNAASKEGSITLGLNGGAQNISWAEIVGFGLPR